MPTPPSVQAALIWTVSTLPFCFADIQLSEKHRPFKPLRRLPAIFTAEDATEFPLLPVWNEPLIWQPGATVNAEPSSLLICPRNTAPSSRFAACPRFFTAEEATEFPLLPVWNEPLIWQPGTIVNAEPSSLLMPRLNRRYLGHVTASNTVMPTPLSVQAALIWTVSTLPFCFADIQLSEEHRPFKPLRRLPAIFTAEDATEFPLLPVWNEPLIWQPGATVNAEPSSLLMPRLHRRHLGHFTASNTVMPTPLSVQAALIWTVSTLPFCFADIQLSEEHRPFKPLRRLPAIFTAEEATEFLLLPVWNEPLIWQPGAIVNAEPSSLLMPRLHRRYLGHVIASNTVMPTPLSVQAAVIWTVSTLPFCFADIQLSEEHRPFKPLRRLPAIFTAEEATEFPLLPVWNEPLIWQPGAIVNAEPSSLLMPRLHRR
ncbi:hypothetical protein MRX96_052651 [Rhipicephalus microplus]